MTSYGGELRFTVTQRPRPSSAPLHRQPLVVLQGNNIVLEHHASREPSPGQPSNFIVPFQEVSPIPSLLVPLFGGPQHPGCQEWISCPFLYSKRGSGLMGSQPHGSTY